MKAEKKPVSIRKLELGVEIPALADEVDALKAKLERYEAERNVIVSGYREILKRFHEVADEEARRGRPDLREAYDAIEKS